MKQTISLEDIVASTLSGFLHDAANAPSEEVKTSLLRCAEAAKRLGEKLAVLQTQHQNIDLVIAMTETPEHQLLVRERNIRYALKKEGKVDGQ